MSQQGGKFKFDIKHVFLNLGIFSKSLFSLKYKISALDGTRGGEVDTGHTAEVVSGTDGSVNVRVRSSLVTPDCRFSVQLLFLLLKKVRTASLRESDIHPISPETPAPQYQTGRTEREK